jgi:hypothetical protein
VKRAHALLTLGAALLLGASPAAGEPRPVPSAAPAAPAAPAASAVPAASALPPGHPAVGDSLPAGHPAVGEPLPAGHPPVADDDDDAPEDPHGNAAGAGHAGDPRFFNPPEDTVVDDPSLPAGTVVVTIKDAHDQPVPRAPILVGVLHSTVAKGDSNERLSREGDEGGSARFDGLAFGSGHTYRVSTTRGQASYAHAPFAITDKNGKRVTLHSYEVSPNLDELPIAMQAMVYVSLREDSIQVEQLVSVYNLGPVAWMADTTVQLPKGFKAFNKQDSMDDARVEEVPGGAALRGTFPPGRRDMDFRYQVPLDDDARQTMRLSFPPRVAQARVIAEASRSMSLEVPGFPPAKRVEGRDGKHLLVTEQQVARAAGGVSSVELTLGGLPTQGPGRWIAVALAILVFGSGVVYFVLSFGGPLDADARGDLVEAREALLGEMVALERARKSGEVGPRTYARVRASLLEALARIVAMIEAATPAKKPGPRSARAAGSNPKPRRRMEASP